MRGGVTAALLGVLALAGSTLGLPGSAVAGASTANAPEAGREFSVLAVEGASLGAVEAAIRASGGTVERSNAAVGLLTVRAARDGFTGALRASGLVDAVAAATPIGRVPDLLPLNLPVGGLTGAPSATPGTTGVPALGKSATAGESARPAGPSIDPLDTRLWGLSNIHADQARKSQPGDERVLVGILDTGVDGTHPDIAPNFSKKLSRNFTKDIVEDANGGEVDGPCEVRSCVDPNDRDDNGHGTHVAGTIAAAADGFGVSGVAPGVTIVNVRAGADSGLFFLQPTVDAITYAGDIGLDVLNMSFYIDPWLENCPDNLVDSPEERELQKLTITAVTRAMKYADGKGVTSVVSLGNSNADLDNPLPIDDSSPNFPKGTARPRLVDPNTCRSLPLDDPHAVGVGATGPSGGKSNYSNYGSSISVAAPGGWVGDYAGTPDGDTLENAILSAYPRDVAYAEGALDIDGAVTAIGRASGVLADCRGKVCGYYRYLQGTSMASPHVSGVAALIVSEFGRKQGNGFGLAPADVRKVLEGTATARACPDPLTTLATYGGTCAGDEAFNTFYGHGEVDALAAITRGRAILRR